MGHSGRSAARLSQRRNAAQGHHHPRLSGPAAAVRRAGRPKIINLSRSYGYQSNGYYASLLAEARGHRVIPTVETMLDLREAKLYEQSLPELEEALNSGPASRLRRAEPSSSFSSASAIAQDQGSRPSAGCCSTGSAARRWK